jgi:dTDP-4-amino-4,6-dideoxygalactose transaminase
MSRPVAVADPRSTFREVGAELRDAFAEVLEGGRYILGDQVDAFEREWAAACGAGQAVGVSSGTDALALALRAVGVNPGDEVLVPAMTAVATWMAVAQIGAVPVGVDIETTRRGMDPERASEALTSRTRALVAVHLFGQPADVNGLREVAAAAGVPLIEDAAQAHGARVDGRPVGSLGAVAAFSFYPTKNLGAVGDAGAVTCSDAELAARVRRLREYGWRTRNDATEPGFNARIDELQAALLRVLLPGLEARTARRRAIAERYLAELADCSDLTLPTVAAGTEPVWHLFVVTHADRDGLARRLIHDGIGTAVHYATLPSLNTAFAAQDSHERDFPVAARHARTALSLPLHPSLGDDEVERVIAAVRAACPPR